MSEPRPPAPIDWEEGEGRLAPRALAAGDATGWFDQLYARARADASPCRGAAPSRIRCSWTGPSTDCPPAHQSLV